MRRVYPRLPRFKVESSFPVIAKIKQCPMASFRLQTLSHKGFGLYVSGREARLVQASAVDIVFEWGREQKRTIEVRARVEYCRFVRNESGGANFLGIVFNHEDSRIDLLLEMLVKKGIEKGHLQEIPTPVATT